jgi:hypothetical protein
MKLPSPKKIYARPTTGNIFATKEELDSCESRFKSDKRDSKIECVLNNTPYDSTSTLEKDPEYIELRKKGVHPLGPPSNTLFYLEYKNNNSL